MPDLPPLLAPELIMGIMEILNPSPYRTVHYTGAADEGLLQALLAETGRFGVRVMDMPDRWGSGLRFFWEEFESSGSECPEKPGWLNDVPFYQEGAPDHDICLYDWDLESRTFGQFVSFTGRRPPRIAILFGRADMQIRHRSYSWETRGPLRIGRWREGIASAWDHEQARREMIRKSQFTE